MTLRGKDFCNCAHARLLIEAIESAWAEMCVQGQADTRADKILKAAIDAHEHALLDYIHNVESE